MTDKDWETIIIEEIQITDNSDIVFTNFKSKDDVTKFTSRARNLPHDKGQSGPRLVMFVDRRGMKRHKAFMTIAKSLREHSKEPIQTSVRTGKNDYLLRSRSRGSTTPWNEIPPLQILKEIPEFEIGQYNDLVNPQNNPQEVIEEEEEKDEIEDMDEIVKDINKQNEVSQEDLSPPASHEDPNTNKRDRSTDDTSQGRKKNVRVRSNQSTLNEVSADESDEDNISRQVLNSTQNPGCKVNMKSHSTGSKSRQKPTEIMHYFSVPETPCGTFQPPRRNCQNIPETPEVEEDKSRCQHPRMEDASYKEHQLPEKKKKNTKKNRKQRK